MKISCDYCDCTITNKNKQFCNIECMASFMRLKECYRCHEKYEPDEDVFDGCSHFCSQKCSDEHDIEMYIHNIECAIGYGMHGPHFGHDLVEIRFRVKNKKTGEIIEGRVGSKEEEIEYYTNKQRCGHQREVNSQI